MAHQQSEVAAVFTHVVAAINSHSLLVNMKYTVNTNANVCIENFTMYRISYFFNNSFQSHSLTTIKVALIEKELIN